MESATAESHIALTTLTLPYQMPSWRITYPMLSFSSNGDYIVLKKDGTLEPALLLEYKSETEM